MVRPTALSRMPPSMSPPIRKIQEAQADRLTASSLERHFARDKMANLFIPSCEPLNLSLKIFDLLLTII